MLNKFIQHKIINLFNFSPSRILVVNYIPIIKILNSDFEITHNLYDEYGKPSQEDLMAFAWFCFFMEPYVVETIHNQFLERLRSFLNLMESTLSEELVENWVVSRQRLIDELVKEMPEEIKKSFEGLGVKNEEQFRNLALAELQSLRRDFLYRVKNVPELSEIFKKYVHGILPPHSFTAPSFIGDIIALRRFKDMTNKDLNDYDAVVDCLSHGVKVGMKYGFPILEWLYKKANTAWGFAEKNKQELSHFICKSLYFQALLTNSPRNNWMAFSIDLQNYDLSEDLVIYFWFPFMRPNPVLPVYSALIEISGFMSLFGFLRVINDIILNKEGDEKEGTNLYSYVWSLVNKIRHVREHDLKLLFSPEFKIMVSYYMKQRSSLMSEACKWPEALADFDQNVTRITSSIFEEEILDFNRITEEIGIGGGNI